jgi:hypothetical protein
MFLGGNIRYGREFHHPTPVTGTRRRKIRVLIMGDI